jgi:uncharacterized peroxidase-related enzyme
MPSALTRGAFGASSRLSVRVPGTDACRRLDDDPTPKRRAASKSAMAEDPMTRFPVPDHEELPEDIRERIERETDEAGFTPNVFSAFAYRPEEFRAFFDYHDALVEDAALDRAEVEMLVVTVSGVNDCLYCVVAHGALLRIYADDPQLADQLATNHRSAALSDRHRAMLDFAVELTESPGEVDGADVQALREAGFSQEQVWDVGSVVAYYNLSNRLATMADMRPNEEFYSLGRTNVTQDTDGE